jgi:hypothetical protein
MLRWGRAAWVTSSPPLLVLLAGEAGAAGAAGGRWKVALLSRAAEVMSNAKAWNA